MFYEQKTPYFQCNSGANLGSAPLQHLQSGSTTFMMKALSETTNFSNFPYFSFSFIFF